jgi:hypothetical protein
MAIKQLIDEPKRINKLQAFMLTFEKGMGVAEFQTVERSAADIRLMASCTLHDAHHAFMAQYGKISIKLFVRFLKRSMFVSFHRSETGRVYLSSIKLSAAATTNRPN